MNTIESHTEDIYTSLSRAILSKARSKIADPERWVKRAFTTRRRHNGRMITCYCLDGALDATRYKIQDVLDAEIVIMEVIAAKSQALHRHDHRAIVPFNDCHLTTHEEVLYVLDTAIAKCAKEA